MDILYVIKSEILNEDLRYSLRALDQFVTGFDRVFVAGFKPLYVKGVSHVPTRQFKTKYQNVLNNILTAVKTTDISDDFVLMNDDFIALRPIDLSKDPLNYASGTLADKVDEVAGMKPSRWREGFKVAAELLPKISRYKKFYNFAVHTPYIINKHKLLEMMDKPEVKEVLDSGQTFLLRVVYGNLYRRTKITHIRDCKLRRDEDLSKERMDADWLSVYDGVLGNGKYPKLLRYTKKILGKPCRFEL